MWELSCFPYRSVPATWRDWPPGRTGSEKWSPMPPSHASKQTTIEKWQLSRQGHRLPRCPLDLIHPQPNSDPAYHSTYGAPKCQVCWTAWHRDNQTQCLLPSPAWPCSKPKWNRTTCSTCSFTEAPRGQSPRTQAIGTQQLIYTHFG